ncbi:multifunctional CCA addition/repair protein [Candidatus Erwinia haradaeae]|uniref:CCA-adding enzyme n=1 Tax=Candidatus Erwinia haradaeae TaxID=1922217 RepID=A0A803GCG5_9GAMM|nr:multifunctional CCA addition/repair protein [Candidatus Erwinia haradaeae]VFP87955.1 Multifunctional CCA protein [Candidatus Erwinia haradaeae]
MKIYLVGGAVRNKLLDLPLKDKDWVVVGSSSQKMIDLGYHQVGRNFPVFLHPDTGEEYALARTERKLGQGYTGFICHTSPDVTLEQDLARRDLTINAIAQDQNGTYYDPYGGLIDLKNRKLRHVSSSFHEDPLRLLRVARFAASFAHLKFQIVDETLEIMQNMSKNGEICSLPPERIWKELEAALRTDHPDVFLQVLQLCGALTVLFPELDSINNVYSTTYSQPATQIHLHTPMALSIIAKLSKDIDMRFAALIYDLILSSLGQIKWISHDKLDLSVIFMINSLCKRLAAPNTLRDLTMVIIRFHHIVDMIQCCSPSELVSFFNNIDAWRKPFRIDQIALASEAFFSRKNNFINFSYSQSDYLYQAWRIVKNVSIKEILHSGYKGKEVHHELIHRRILSLSRWKGIQV